MKSKRYKTCKHAIECFDQLVLTDLECRHYGLICGTAMVTKHICQYCECLERKNVKALNKSNA